MMAKLAASTPAEILQLAVRAGIYNEDGTLTEPYGGRYTSKAKKEHDMSVYRTSPSEPARQPTQRIDPSIAGHLGATGVTSENESRASKDAPRFVNVSQAELSFWDSVYVACVNSGGKFVQESADIALLARRTRFGVGA